MEAIWYLLVLAPFLAIPILWWNYRRQVAVREDTSGARWGQLVSAARTASANSTGNAELPAAVPQGRYVRRDRLLDPAQTVLYYLLKNGLPDHEVMVQVGLANLLAVPAAVAASEGGPGGTNLAQHRVDFVICNKAMQPVVAIDLLEREVPAALTSAPDFKSQCLAHTGIRYLRLVSSALPKHQEVRALVLGA
ncbi:MAG: DUF2726 domain-containing protein [Burkholderiales bacterium]|nr:DUF2726 domain-containing protein [Burkholderiales bacterium]